MDRLGRIFRSPVTTLALFALAVILLLTSGVGGARAALTYFSENYTSRVEMYDIGVTLQENGERVSWRDYGSAADGSWTEHTGALLTKMLGEGESLQLGKSYPEVLTVRNSGTIDEYVRVSIYCYWVDRDGNKLQNLDPGLIDLHLLTGNGWTEDTASATAERRVLYYDSVLPATDENGEQLAGNDPRRTTSAFSDTLTINPAVAAKVTQSESTEERDGRTYRIITTSYDYDGVEFRVELQADAVQTHNADAATRSAWGEWPTTGGNGG